ncbi:hypothetical protein AADZ90_000265 [Aestuariibius sp. 2305UL40-4]|uniref:hypothetical protein n=1 Tax=Aestuariibius violaceus TaxID=3234132 RepID=UPI00345F0FC1
MYWPIPGIKKHPKKRWDQPDRIFFGFGACHILAGVFLEDAPVDGFHGEWIVQADGFGGNHIFVTNGKVAFDFHGYSLRRKLLSRYWAGYQDRYPGWRARIVRIDFPPARHHCVERPEASRTRSVFQRSHTESEVLHRIKEVPCAATQPALIQVRAPVTSP